MSITAPLNIHEVRADSGAATTSARQLGRLVALETLKLRTTPALYIAGAVSAGLAAVQTVTTILLAGRSGTPALGTTDNASKALSVAAVTSMVALVMGIISAAGEYRTRTIVGSYLAEPRRGRVLTAKLITSAALGAVLGALSYGMSLAIAVALYAAKGVHHVPVSVGGLWLGTVLSSACFALLGVGLGALTRNTFGAVVGGLVWVQIVEVAILHNVVPSVGRWLPTEAAVAITTTGDQAAGLLAAPTAALVLVGWSIALTVGAVAFTVGRDVS